MSDALAKRDRVLSVPLRPDELDRARAAAAEAGLAVGTWARINLLKLLQGRVA